MVWVCLRECFWELEYLFWRRAEDLGGRVEIKSPSVWISGWRAAVPYFCFGQNERKWAYTEAWGIQAKLEEEFPGCGCYWTSEWVTKVFNIKTLSLLATDLWVWVHRLHGGWLHTQAPFKLKSPWHQHNPPTQGHESQPTPNRSPRLGLS